MILIGKLKMIRETPTSVGQAIAIVIFGLMCGLKNLKQIHEWATGEPVRTFFDKEMEYI